MSVSRSRRQRNVEHRKRTSYEADGIEQVWKLRWGLNCRETSQRRVAELADLNSPVSLGLWVDNPTSTKRPGHFAKQVRKDPIRGGAGFLVTSGSSPARLRRRQAVASAPSRDRWSWSSNRTNQPA